MTNETNDKDTEPWEYRPPYKGIMDKLTSNPIWYDGTPLLSKNGLINILYGKSGIGKSFFFKAWTLLSAPGETVWMRRHEKELHRIKNTFASTLDTEGFLSPEQEIKIKNNVLSLDGRPRIHFVALDTCTRKSTTLPAVNWVIFDDFIEEYKNRSYHFDEAETFVDYLFIINGLRKERRAVRAFLIGNKVSWVNDYTAFFDVKPFEGRFKSFKSFSEGNIVVENYQNPTSEETADSAIRDASFDDGTQFIRRRPKQSKLFMNVRLKNTFYGLWTDDEGMYVSMQANPSMRVFAPRDDLREGESALITSKPPVSVLMEYSKKGMLWYDNAKCKMAMLKIMMKNWR